MLFRVCKIENTYLICSRNGRILRFNKCTKKWSICKGNKNNGYLHIGIDRKGYQMHRVIAHAFKILDLHSNLEIDHIDRNKTNNCISNLRPVTNQQNQFNTNAKGYFWHNNKWEAQICLDGKRIYLGRYDTEEDAHNAYLKAKEIYHVL